MKTLLIFPPQAQPFLPHLGIPSLTAALKDKGVDVVQKDYNIECYEWYLSPEKLIEIGVSPYIAHQVEDVKNSIRTGYDYVLPSDYYANINILEEYLTFTARSCPDSFWSLKDYQSKYSEYSSDEILEAVLRKKEHLFYNFFQHKLSEIKEIQPELTGISVCWKSQLIPAVILASMIKESFPQIHIVVGGSFISHLSGYLKQKRKMFTYIDSFLPYEAETGIVKLEEIIRTNGDLAKVPGLIYLKRKKIFSISPELPPNLNLLPSPVFDGFPLEKYYSPQKYLPISSSRGCYWAKCAFCTHHLSGSAFRRKNAENLLQEMNNYYEKYQCKNFYFVDDAMPPISAKKLAMKIAADGKPYRWLAEFRAEPVMDKDYFQTLYNGGCKMALFGLESFCQRTLDNMNKGWKKETFSSVIQNCSNAGILNWVFFFLGFPGERRYEALETLGFIVQNRKFIDMIAGGSFVLTKDSNIHRHPESFAIKEIFDNKNSDLQLNYTYSLKEGIDGDTQEELLNKFRRIPEVDKFLEPFVAESHLLFFRKSYFQSKFKENTK